VTGVRSEIAARDLVPGDVLIVGEGDRSCADARIIDGALVLDPSTLTGESLPVSRSGEPADTSCTFLDAIDMVWPRRISRASRSCTLTTWVSESGLPGGLSRRSPSRIDPSLSVVARWLPPRWCWSGPVAPAAA
jgi:magnesium-transporting ATPase (P-type)